MKTASKSTLALLLVTVAWGWTFLWMDQAIVAGRSVAPDGLWVTITLYMTCRFGLAALCVPLFVKGSIRRYSYRELQGGASLGMLLVVGFLLQMWGLDTVSAPVSAFLTSLYVLFTLAISMIIHRKSPGAGVIVGALLATVGAGYISGPPQANFGLGEALSVASALLFAIHILATGFLTGRDSPAALTFISFLVTGVLTGAILIVCVSQSPGIDFQTVLAIATHPGFVAPTLLSSFFATTLALTIMNFHQRNLPPVRAAIIYALEPVWASVFALSLGQAEPSTWLLLGGGCLLAGNLVAELTKKRPDGPLSAR